MDDAGYGLLTSDENMVKAEVTVTQYHGSGSINVGFGNTDYTTSVPEPSTSVLLIMGCVGLCMRRKKRT